MSGFRAASWVGAGRDGRTTRTDDKDANSNGDIGVDLVSRGGSQSVRTTLVKAKTKSFSIQTFSIYSLYMKVQQSLK